MTKSKVPPTKRFSVWYMNYEWSGSFDTREEAVEHMKTLYDDSELRRDISDLGYVGKSPKDFLKINYCDADELDDIMWRENQ